jgi:HSP20 family protein
MTELTVRRSETRPSQLERDWDPFRWMREMMRWDPFRGGRPMMTETTGYFPDFDVKDSKEGLVLRADLPGVKEADIEITLTGNRLTIGGKREAEKEEKGETYYACERSYGAFTRSFTLPSDVDPAKIHAELKNGVLSVLLPHAPGAQPKKITVKSG